MNPQHKQVVDRVQHLEDAIQKAREYLDAGRHADWHGFRPLFAPKVKDGSPLPPHPDWVRNVFLPSRERALTRAERTLERVEAAAERGAAGRRRPVGIGAAPTPAA